MQASFYHFELIVLAHYYKNEENIEKGVPQTAKISKLERIFSKSPSQLELGGEHLFWGTAREVLFIHSNISNVFSWKNNCIHKAHFLISFSIYEEYELNYGIF